MKEKLMELSKLVETFKTNIKDYKSNKYDEANTRVDYIDKFFELLDWDVRNLQSFSEQYREVVREDKVIIQGKPKAPDYSFRIGGIRKFFVEAKKPAVNIKEDTEPAYQVRRYSYTAKLPLSILTDFEEFAVYDTRIKPNKNDKASVARIFYCTYEEYEKNFEFIYNTFSKTAILQGSFDKYIEENKNKKGTSEVDKEFLKMIEWWREILARTLALRNKDLDLHNLNFAVQKIIDRLIFLRIAEDRRMEKYGRLYELINKNNIYQSLNEIFLEADRKYNSGLFHIESWLTNLNIDEKILIKIIKGLYYPESPYEFSVLPIEILGHVYEQFLGKTIRLTKSHQAKVEEKPEVRKAGGVYYTPQYIVDYIVKNTVGEKIKNKSPKEIEKLTILDPACGSGSFLVGAYNFLLKYHLEYYSRDKNKAKAISTNKIYQIDKETYKLTIKEKQNILLNNIYGVDIDSQAVEVTKLSLLLKLMEDENVEGEEKLFKHSDLKILPDLSNNIKCGNSLIGSDYFENKNLSIFGDDEMRKINPFDWDNEFSTVFADGGFDVVIGNPPYVKERGNQEIFAPVLQSKYKKYHQGKMDYWYYFLHRAIDVCNDNGFIGFITNSYWLNSYGARKLINRVKKELTFKKVVYFDDIKVFLNVSGKHMIHIYQKNKKDDTCLYIELDKNNFHNKINDNLGINIKNQNIKKYKDRIVFSNEINIFNNMDILDTDYEVSQGVIESTDKISRKQYDNSKNKNNFNIGDGIFVLSYKELKNLKLNKKEKNIVKKYVNTNHVKRYYINFQNQYLLYCDKEVKKNISSYPNIKRHLDNVKEFITSSNKPYGLHRPRESKFFEQPKIICKGMFSYPEFYLDYDKYYFGFSFASIIQRNKNYSLEFLLGLLNSKCGAYWFKKNGKKRGIGVDIGVTIFRQFPISNLDFNKPKDKDKHNKLVGLVHSMIDTQKQFHSAKTDNDKKIYQKKIDIIDNQIDNLVYQLYGLTDEEIKIVEEQ